MYEFTLIQLLLMFALVTVIGVIIGYLIVEVLGGGTQNRKVRQMEQEIARLEAYKLEVNRHFQKTAGLLHQMTSQYKSVYEHMAEGAQHLCDEEAGNEILQSLQSGLLDEKHLMKIDASGDEADKRH